LLDHIFAVNNNRKPEENKKVKDHSENFSLLSDNNQNSMLYVKEADLNDEMNLPSSFNQLCLENNDSFSLSIDKNF